MGWVGLEWHRSRCSEQPVPFPCPAETLQEHTVACRHHGEDDIHLERGFSGTLRSGLILNVLACLAFTVGGGWSISPTQLTRLLEEDISVTCSATCWSWSPYGALCKEKASGSGGMCHHQAPICSWKRCRATTFPSQGTVCRTRRLLALPMGVNFPLCQLMAAAHRFANSVTHNGLCDTSALLQTMLLLL